MKETQPSEIIQPEVVELSLDELAFVSGSAAVVAQSEAFGLTQKWKTILPDH